MTKKEYRPLQFREAQVSLFFEGPLHATTPATPAGIKFMLARTPPTGELEARVAAGERIMGIPELEDRVLAEVNASEGEEEQRAVFRRDEKARPFLHHNFVKGHLRDAAQAIGRAVTFWGFQRFVSETLFVRPERIYLPDGTEVKEEVWPTHFDIYRMGRVSAFCRAEFVAGVRVAFTVRVTDDSRWTQRVLEDLFLYGSQKGMGGGRGRGLGMYTYELGPLTHSA